MIGAFVLALAAVFFGVGMTFGWWLGLAAVGACWILAPYHPRA